MSRATWYRLGKPDKPRKPRQKRTLEGELEAAKIFSELSGTRIKSWRTYQRVTRVMESPLAPYVISGMSVSLADKILASPGGAEHCLKVMEMWNAACAQSKK